MKVRVLRDVRSDLPFILPGSAVVVKAGFHEIGMNPHGAIHAVLDDGTTLGLRLDEFEFLTLNDANEWRRIQGESAKLLREQRAKLEG